MYVYSYMCVCVLAFERLYAMLVAQIQSFEKQIVTVVVA